MIRCTRTYYEHILKLEKELSQTYPRFQWDVLGRECLPVEADKEENFVVRAEVRINDIKYTAQTIIRSEIVYEMFDRAIAMTIDSIALHVMLYLCKKAQ
jgi:hypothetical protein